MPNPFIRLGSQVQSKPVDDRPEAVPPVPEEYAGVNNPYRGIEDHGVKPNDKPTPPGMWSDNHEGFTYVHEESAQPPIPVEIVSRFVREYQRFRILRASVDNTRGIQFTGRNDARTRMLIKNRSAANSVFLYHEPIDPVSGLAYGYELAAGESFDLFSEAPVWVVGQSATMVTVQAVEYYTVQE